MDRGAAGLNLKREHYAHLLEQGPGSAVQWFEVISENFFQPGGRPWAVLERLRCEVPIGLHGTAMGLGDADGVSHDYLGRLKALVDRLQPLQVSDHLCFVSHGGTYSHELLPLPFTEEAVRHVVEQIDRVQEHLGRRILIENVSTYLRFEGAEMDEAMFVAEVAQRADCGILLDLNNIRVNGHNHGLDPVAYVDAMPRERVAEYHLAGATPAGGLWIDTHVGPVPEAVWSLYAYALDRIGSRPTLIEWDTDVPDYEVVARECERAQLLSTESDAA